MLFYEPFPLEARKQWIVFFFAVFEQTDHHNANMDESRQSDKIEKYWDFFRIFQSEQFNIFYLVCPRQQYRRKQDSICARNKVKMQIAGYRIDFFRRDIGQQKHSQKRRNKSQFNF